MVSTPRPPREEMPIIKSFPCEINKKKPGKSHSERTAADKTCPCAEFPKSVAVKLILPSLVNV